MKLRHHVRRISAESAELPHNLPPRVSVWLLAFFGAGLGPLLFAAAVSMQAAVTPHGPLPIAEGAFNWLQAMAILSLLFVQSFALAGLAGRRDWGRGMAVLACGLWCFTVVGIVPAAITVFLLFRWKYNDTSREADAPHWLRWACAGAAALLAVGWFAFMDWLRQTVIDSTAAHGHAVDLLPVLLVATWVVALPILTLQLAALYGLLTRRHWGREAATAAALLWACTLVGIPVAWAAIRTLWPRALPVVAPAHT